MKIVLDPSNYVFDPPSKTIDFSTFAAFNQTRLLAIINTDYNGGELIFSTAGQGVTGGFFSGSVMTFVYPVDSLGMNSTDNLCVLYEDEVAGGATIAATDTYDSGTITGTPSNAINNTGTGILCSPYRTAYFQLTSAVGGTVRLVPQGSMDNSTFYDLPGRVISGTDAGSMIRPGQTWDTTGPDILAVALDCNYVRLRVNSSGASSYRVATYFTQAPYASPYAFQMLLSDGARPINYGTGTATAQTLRVVPASDSTVNQPEVLITGTGQSAANINLLTGTAAGYDVQGYRSISFQIIGTASVTGGAFIPEQSNDNSNWQSCVYYQNNSALPSFLSTQSNVSSNFNQVYQASLTCRYFRIRISSGITGTSATITAHARLMPSSHSTGIVGISGNVNANNAQLSGTLFTDLSDTLSTISTFTSGSNNNANYGTFTVGARVASFSGTGTPSLDIRIEESFDNAQNWIPLYQFERITATGTYYSPPLRATGTHIRYWRQTLGSTINVNTIVSRQTKQVAATYIKNIVDRTIAPNTLSSTTPVLMCEGCNKFQLVVSSAAGATVNPVIKLQGSEDNNANNWYDISGISVTATPSTTVVANSGTNEDLPKFIRAIVATAGTGAVLNYVVLKAQGKP